MVNWVIFFKRSCFILHLIHLITIIYLICSFLVHYTAYLDSTEKTQLESTQSDGVPFKFKLGQGIEADCSSATHLFWRSYWNTHIQEWLSKDGISVLLQWELEKNPFSIFGQITDTELTEGSYLHSSALILQGSLFFLVCDM